MTILSVFLGEIRQTPCYVFELSSEVIKSIEQLKIYFTRLVAVTGLAAVVVVLS